MSTSIAIIAITHYCPGTVLDQLYFKNSRQIIAVDLELILRTLGTLGSLGTCTSVNRAVVAQLLRH